MDYVKETEKNVPIKGEYDICIVGGGCTGTFAAIRAARRGAKVALIEKNGSLGGLCTSAHICSWHSIYDFDFNQKIIAGLTEEVLESLKYRNQLTIYDRNINMFRFNSEELKIVLDEKAIEAGVDLFFHTLYVETMIYSGKVKGVFIEDKDGRGFIGASVFVDATGDGDMCRDVGAIKAQYDIQIMPPSPCFKLYKKKEYPVYITELIKEHGIEFGIDNDWGWNSDIPGIPNERVCVETHIQNVPCINAANITKCEIIGRQQIKAVVDLLRKYMPDGDPVQIASIGSEVGIREGNKYITVYKLLDDDVLGVGNHFDDAILNSCYPMDLHHSNGEAITMKYLDGLEKTYNRKTSSFMIWKEYACGEYPKYWQAPYRLMLISNCDNVLACGRMIDCERGAYSALRVHINLNQLGEAAGEAAVLALSVDNNYHDVDSKCLRQRLRDGGSIVLG